MAVLVRPSTATCHRQSVLGPTPGGDPRIAQRLTEIALSWKLEKIGPARHAAEVSSISSPPLPARGAREWRVAGVRSRVRVVGSVRNRYLKCTCSRDGLDACHWLYVTDPFSSPRVSQPRQKPPPQ